MKTTRRPDPFTVDLDTLRRQTAEKNPNAGLFTRPLVKPAAQLKAEDEARRARLARRAFGAIIHGDE